MCQFISFFHRPDTGDIAVAVLDLGGLTKQERKIVVEEYERNKK